MLTMTWVKDVAIMATGTCKDRANETFNIKWQSDTWLF